MQRAHPVTDEERNDSDEFDPEAVARRQSSPYTGKLSARPAGKPGFSIAKENLRRSLPRHSHPPQATPARPFCVFQAWRNLSVRWSSKPKSKTKTSQTRAGVPPPVGRPPMPGKGRDGRNYAPCSSSAMSSGRLFLDRVARQHCPSPLHRRSQNNMLSQQARARGDISILPGRGHFYFALTPVVSLLDAQELGE